MVSFYFGTNEYYPTFLLMMMSMSTAALDVIVDSIMVIQSRRFPDDGSEQLQTFSWLCMSMGGIVGSLEAAVLTEHYHPNWSFFVSSFPAMVMLIVSIRLSPKIEKEDDEEDKSEP